MMVKFETIFFRELTAAAAITALYGIAGWDMREPLAVFGMFAAGLSLQGWVIGKWEVRKHAKAHRSADGKHSARRTA